MRVYILTFFVVKFFGLIFGFAGKTYAQARQGVHVYVCKNYRRMHFTVAKFWQLFKGVACVFARNRADRQSDEKFVCVQSGVAVA